MSHELSAEVACVRAAHGSKLILELWIGNAYSQGPFDHFQAEHSRKPLVHPGREETRRAVGER